ncbi:hypothetical protein C0991_001557 [Blastosporella zonata]|nr:hypothetical protein C0991_001557 [Blastosporella zonata]
MSSSSGFKITDAPNPSWTYGERVDATPEGREWLEGEKADTASNIKATKGFTVNIISEAWVAQSNITSVDAPEDFSEWPVSGLTKEPSIHVRAPRVKESAFSMECELLEAVDVKAPSTGEVTTTLILGTVKYIHVRKDVLDERGNVDPGKLKPVARMGGTLYAKVNEGYNIYRPNWKDHGEPIQEASATNESGRL